VQGRWSFNRRSSWALVSAPDGLSYRDGRTVLSSWTLTSKAGQGVGKGLFPTGACTWNFGNVIPGVTTQNFGRDAQYGQADFARYGGTAASAIRNNPEVTGQCKPLTEPT